MSNRKNRTISILAHVSAMHTLFMVAQCNILRVTSRSFKMGNARLQ